MSTTSTDTIFKKVLAVLNEHQAQGKELHSGDFGLPQTGRGANARNFADGALDGIMYFHMDTAGEAVPEEITAALEKASVGDFAGAAEDVDNYFGDPDHVRTMLECTDQLTGWVRDNNENLDFNNLYRLAISILMRSSVIESVKLALLLLEFTDNGAKEIHDMIRILSACGEFTLFSCFSMSYWEDRAAALGDAAQINDGWGRIFAIHFMNRQDLQVNPILGKWLLYEGRKNTVSPGYSAYKIADLINLPVLLLDDAMDVQDYRAVRELLPILLEEEPVPGLSAFSGDEQIGIINGYLKQAGKYAAQDEDYRVLNTLYDYIADYILEPAEDEEVQAAAEEILKRIRRILDNDEGKRYIRKMLNERTGFTLARDMGIDCTEQIYNALKRDFVGYGKYASRLFTRESSRKMVLKLATEKLPLAAMKDLTADHDLQMEEKMIFFCLKELLAELADYPGSGEELVLGALDIRVEGCREAALQLVEDWKENGYRVSAAIAEKL